ncbi:hypothetical protein CO705_17815 [Ralstonia pickettii]|uniref:Transmembrane protein n=1 Tax=Ralstonia mannitolilytica TaxID=105219 RepID=A0ABM9KGP1_9RALS|nr:hypothetical protein [Ralstonia mannitolilytica]ATG21788.1 hypothetical protein CO705_17815 [Ralstonia pickettii]CAJ0853867.1 hypothetical protein R77569_00741 [Ralstonia mannitolilytica]
MSRLRLLLVVLACVSMPALAQTTGDTCCTAEQFAVIGIDGPTIFQWWSWGFGVVTGCWWVGLGVGVIVQAIRKA